MPPEEQPTTPIAKPEGPRASASGQWQAPSVGQMQAVLPQYEVLEMLGRGGMGAVYKARQRSLKRLVAIKVLPLEAADDELKFAERFQNEAQTMAAMNHPAIVSVYDFGETRDGLLYFIMEFVDGTDVQQMIQASGRLSPEQALAITAHVCDALAYAHKRGVIHRDIKPANILIDQEGHIKVADFGLAKMNDPSMTSGLTRSNMAMGTPDYVAPEVFKPGLVADHRADLYAVGVMLYQMLTGEVPRGMFKLPSRAGCGTDVRFDGIICRAMEHDREERYQSAMDVRRALDEIRTTPQAKEDGTGVVDVAKMPLQTASAVPKPPRSTSKMWMASGGIAAVLGVVGIFMVGGHERPEKGKTTATSTGATNGRPALGKLTASFFSSVEKASGPRQVELVGEKIKELNGVPVILVPTIEKGKVLKLVVNRAVDTKVPDLSPIAALADLQALTIETRGAGDLSWLRGTKINTFTASNDSFPDLKPLTELPLAHLTLKSGPERDYSVLSGLKLRTFVVYGSPVRDISFLKGMQLSNLGLEKTGFTDWPAIRDLPLTECGGDLDPERDGPILRSIPTLRKINGKPAAEFWADAGAKAAAPAGKTIDLLPLVDVKRDALAGEWSRDGDDLVVKAAKPGANGTPRIQLPYQPPEEYDFEIEFTPVSGTNAVYQVLSAQQHSFAWVLDANLKSGMKAGFDRIDVQLLSGRTNGTTMRPKFLTNGQRHRSSVEVRKTGVRALLDGEVLVTYGKSTDVFQSFDSSPSEAMRDTLHLGLAVYDRGIRFHKVTVREISGAGKVDDVPTSPDAPPTLNKWKDITENLREKARTKPGLVVEPDGVRRESGDGPVVSTMLSNETVRDRAARVRFSRGVQISLWSTNRGGNAAVLVQDRRTFFQRQDSATGPTVALIPEVPHPIAFDFNQPHELVVSVKGSTVRAWLDGRFVGEGQDKAVNDTMLALGFFSNTTVEKVEITELDDAAAKGDWQPIFMKPEDFSGDLRDVEFRDGAVFLMKRSHLAPASITAIRSTLRFCASDRTGSLSLRSREGAAYGEEDFACMAYVSPSGGMVMKVRDRTTGSTELKRHDFPLSPALKLEESFTLELRSADGKITASINGHEVGSVPDTWKGGARRFSITPSTTEMTEFRDVGMLLKAGG